MHKSKLITLIARFKQEELHWFQKFLNSPFYNSNKEHVALFKYIKKYHPQLASPKLGKTIAYQKLYPDEKFNPQKLRKAMHGLALLAEEFIMVMYLQKRPFEKKKLLAKGLVERNCYDQFQKKSEEMITQLEAQPFRDISYYKEIHQLNLQYYNHVGIHKQVQNNSSLEIAAEHLDYFYLIQKKRLDLAIRWHIKLFGSKIKNRSLNKAKINLRKDPVFRLYELITSAETTSWNEDHYLKTETLFRTEIDKIAPQDQGEIIRILLNHLSNQINKGQQRYYANMFALYKFGLKKNLLFENGEIRETTFANIATTGILEREYDWVENFIKAYRQYLPGAIQKDAYYLSLGLLFFYKQQYKDTVRLLLNKKFSNPLYTLKAKAILLRTYFEQFLLDESYYELLIAQTHAFEKFVRRNNAVSENRKEIYTNFILFTRTIGNAVLQKTVKVQLLNKIKNTQAVILKSWLLEKVEGVLKK